MPDTKQPDSTAWRQVLNLLPITEMDEALAAEIADAILLQHGQPQPGQPISTEERALFALDWLSDQLLATLFRKRDQEAVTRARQEAQTAFNERFQRSPLQRAIGMRERGPR